MAPDNTMFTAAEIRIMDERLPPAVCRRPNCDQAAFYGSGFCLEHGLRYVQWRVVRDELERRDLEGAGYDPRDELDPSVAEALDLLFRYLTPGPFTDAPEQAPEADPESDDWVERREQGL